MLDCFDPHNDGMGDVHYLPTAPSLRDEKCGGGGCNYLPTESSLRDVSVCWQWYNRQIYVYSGDRYLICTLFSISSIEGKVSTKSSGTKSDSL